LIEIKIILIQVAKQEKHKKKTGRAKRRLQYKQRFVNKVAGFGRRRGPNSNQPAST
jgi:small subunit ribosomal protein S30e